jgi:hypothetical protein
MPVMLFRNKVSTVSEAAGNINDNTSTTIAENFSVITKTAEAGYNHLEMYIYLASSKS